MRQNHLGSLLNTQVTELHLGGSASVSTFRVVSQHLYFYKLPK